MGYSTVSENLGEMPMGLILALFTEQNGYFIRHPAGAPHWILLHTLSGEGVFADGHGREVGARPGDTTVIGPLTRHDFGIADGCDAWTFQFAQFQGRPEWRNLLDWPEPIPGVLQIHLGEFVHGRVEESLRRAIQFRGSVLKNRDLFSVNALERALLWCDSENPEKRPIDERLLRVVSFVEAGLRADLGIQELAKVATLSPSRFRTLFTNQLGVSPQRFVERRRLEAAARLLDLTKRSISSVGVEVGFDDPLYFSTRFRRLMGVSPLQYRSRSRGEKAD